MLPMYKNVEACANAPLSNPKRDTTPPPPPPPPPIVLPSRNEANHNHNHNQNPNPTATMFSPAPIMLAITSWLRMRRSRYLFLLLCSPLLLPFLCATFPILCAAEICIRICRRTRRKAGAPHDSQEDELLRRCEEGCCCGADQIEEREVGLLQRYLEDQLMLVRSVYECCDDEYADQFNASDRDVEILDCKVPLLS